mmetsp:Transcript_57944/g.172356  ORF Transcript_57944/g.172356 Transcript_57944/m.172356 type:complete len:211 (-) Transcript_57944:908-1540(-)
MSMTTSTLCRCPRRCSRSSAWQSQLASGGSSAKMASEAAERSTPTAHAVTPMTARVGAAGPRCRKRSMSACRSGEGVDPSMRTSGTSCASADRQRRSSTRMWWAKRTTLSPVRRQWPRRSESQASAATAFRRPQRSKSVIAAASPAARPAGTSADRARCRMRRRLGGSSASTSLFRRRTMTASRSSSASCQPRRQWPETRWPEEDRIGSS